MCAYFSLFFLLSFLSSPVTSLLSVYFLFFVVRSQITCMRASIVQNALSNWNGNEIENLRFYVCFAADFFLSSRFTLHASRARDTNVMCQYNLCQTHEANSVEKRWTNLQTNEVLRKKCTANMENWWEWRGAGGGRWKAELCDAFAFYMLSFHNTMCVLCSVKTLCMEINLLWEECVHLNDYTFVANLF